MLNYAAVEGFLKARCMPGACRHSCVAKPRTTLASMSLSAFALCHCGMDVLKSGPQMSVLVQSGHAVV